MAATVIFQTARIDGMRVACLVCPRQNLRKGFRQELRIIVEIGALLLRQYAPSEQTGQAAMAEVDGGAHGRTTMLFMPGATDRRHGNPWEAVLIRLRKEDVCVLICPEGSPFTLPAEFGACAQECRWLWIAQYDPKSSCVMDVVKQLRAGRTAPFTVFELGRPGA